MLTVLAKGLGHGVVGIEDEEHMMGALIVCAKGSTMLPNEARAWLVGPMKACAHLALLAAILLMPRAAQAGSVRTPVDMAAPPWRALGRVQTELGNRCTGFLVAPRVVMTAAHCLFRRVTGRYVRPSSIHFLWRYDEGAYADHARAIAFAVAPGYDPLHELRTLGLDRAFLTLDHSICMPADDVRFAPATPKIGTPLLLGGYNRDHDEVLEADRCRLRGFAVDHGGHRLLVHDCSGEPGTSGAALFTRLPDGGWGVVGLEVAVTGPGGRIGLAEPVTN
jgi:protease YdgD